jgi:hypothetical protein
MITFSTIVIAQKPQKLQKPQLITLFEFESSHMEKVKAEMESKKNVVLTTKSYGNVDNNTYIILSYYLSDIHATQTFYFLVQDRDKNKPFAHQYITDITFIGLDAFSTVLDLFYKQGDLLDCDKEQCFLSEGSYDKALFKSTPLNDPSVFFKDLNENDYIEVMLYEDSFTLRHTTMLSKSTKK